jgi:hypothetical protein
MKTGRGETDFLRRPPYVISGRGIAEAYKNRGAAQFGFERRHVLCPDLLMLWRYDLIDRKLRVPGKGWIWAPIAPYHPI